MGWKQSVETAYFCLCVSYIGKQAHKDHSLPEFNEEVRDHSWIPD